MPLLQCLYFLWEDCKPNWGGKSTNRHESCHNMWNLIAKEPSKFEQHSNRYEYADRLIRKYTVGEGAWGETIRETFSNATLCNDDVFDDKGGTKANGKERYRGEEGTGERNKVDCRQENLKIPSEAFMENRTRSGDTQIQTKGC
ncbi:hypothetical protein Ancab_031535 [Ancistrocladus abbreviatus]